MTVRILEKIYHHTNNPTLSTPFRRQREDHWIKTLDTAFPYGRNDHVKNLGNLTSPMAYHVNVMRHFPNAQRRKRSHGHRSYQRPHIRYVTLRSLLPYICQQLGPHHIRTKLYFAPLKVLNKLLEDVKASSHLDYSTPEYRLNAMIMDVAHHRLF